MWWIEDDHTTRVQPIQRVFRPIPRGVSLALGTPTRGDWKMSLMNVVRPAALVLVLAAPAAAQADRRTSGTSQSPVTTSDIQRLQDQVFDASNEVARMRSRDQA